MYQVGLIIVGIFALLGLVDRSTAGVAVLGAVVMLALLFRKIRQLTRQVDSMEAEIGRLLVHIDTAKQSPEPADKAESRLHSRPDTEAEQETEPQPFAAADNGGDDPSPQPRRPPTAAVIPTADQASAAGSAAAVAAAQQAADSGALDNDGANDAADLLPAAAARSMPDGAVTRRPASSAPAADSTPPPPQSPSPAPPPAPAQPNWFDRLLRKASAAAWDWITGGNVFVRVGILILFLGMTFLIRYAVGQNMIPIEVRLASVGAVAIALLIWGWRQRDRKPNFALVVQGGGIGLLYLTIFASFSLYRVLDSTLAFLMLGVIVILAAILAVRQNARSLALFATVGGFLAPILTSSGSNNYIGLFSYYTVLNIGIFAVAWFKSWRVLNFTGFIFTFAITGIWGLLKYQPEFYATTQPFLIIFFLLYVGISILFALRRSINFKDSIDSSLVFGTPLLAFGMQCELVGGYEYGIATSAFALAAFYLGASYLLWKTFSSRLRLLCETFVSLAVIFATLAIPFAIDGSLTGSVWAIEGAGILWVSIRQQQYYRRLFAVLLMLAAGVILGREIILSADTLLLAKSAFANSAFIGTTLIAIAAAIGSWLLSSPFEGRRSIETNIEYGLLAYSSIVLLLGFGVQVLEFQLFRSQGHLLALLATITGLAYLSGAVGLKWRMANWMSCGFFALLLPAAISSFDQQIRLSEHHGYLLWPLAMTALFFSLHKCRAVMNNSLSQIYHLAAATLLASLLLWEGLWQLLLGFSLLSVVFCKIGERYGWPEIKRCTILYLPVLGLCFAGAIGLDDNLITLSSIGSEVYPPLQPGGLLWPLALATYFYLLWKNPLIGGRFLLYFYLGGALLIVAMLLWLGLWTLLLGATLLCWLAYYLSYQFQWPQMRQLSRLLLPLMALVPIVGLANGITDPVRLISFNIEFQMLPRSGFLLWPLAFVTLYLIYWLSEREKQPPSDLAHALGCLLLVTLTTWEISSLARIQLPFLNPWHLVLLPVVGLLAIHSILRANRWPFHSYREGFERYALLPLALGSLVWSVLQFAASGRSAILPWIPLLNPLDLMQCLILYGWATRGRERINLLQGISSQHLTYALAGFVFLWINVDILRFVHNWTGVAWDFSRLIQADLTQTLMSLIWALMGLAGTFIAARKKHRQIWIIAAALLAVVVVKLFVIDLSAQDTIERIVSFTGVGLLLTFVGYFSPLPPKAELQPETQQ